MSTQSSSSQFIKKNRFVPRTLPPGDLLWEISEVALKLYESEVQEQGIHPNYDLGLGLYFEDDPSFPRDFFGNDLDDIIAACNYASGDSLPEGICLQMQFTPVVVEMNGELVVMYKLFGDVPLPNPEYPDDADIVPLSVFTSRKVGVVEDVERDLWASAKERISQAYRKFNLSRFDYHREGFIMVVSSEYVEDVLCRLARSGYDVKNNEGDSFMISA